LEQDGDFNDEGGQEDGGIPRWVWYAAERVAGAWAEVLSEAARAGVKVPGHANAEEATARLAVLKADIGPLPRLVNAAAFAPGAVSEADAGAATSVVAPFSRTIRHQVKWLRRSLT
jgi:hypothetical protein